MGALEIWTAFSIGLLGSIHCVGMCGPIALALPYQGPNRWKVAGGVFLYNLGRVVTYTLLGAAIGILGKGLLIAGVQTYLSIALGIAILIIAVLAIPVESRIARFPIIARLNQWVSRQMGYFLRQTGRFSTLFIGMLNGLIPCGLVYMAIAGAVSAGGILQGSAYMALFGLGTIPLLAITAVAGQAVNIQWRQRLRRLAPVLMIVIACLFIMRGLQFQTPAALRFWEDYQTVPMCH